MSLSSLWVSGLIIFCNNGQVGGLCHPALVSGKIGGASAFFLICFVTSLVSQLLLVDNIQQSLHVYNTTVILVLVTAYLVFY